MALQLQQPLGLTWPVVLIWGRDAEKLMEFVYKNRKAHVRIELKEPPAWVSSEAPWAPSYLPLPPALALSTHPPLCSMTTLLKVLKLLELKASVSCMS